MDKKDFNWDGFKLRLFKKRNVLRSNRNIYLSEFGSRRRASFEVQRDVLIYLSDFISSTSNMKLAMDYGFSVIGTMPHEWIMGISALESLRYANRYALNRWQEVFPVPGIALSDTFGVDAFFRDFNPTLSRLYDGTRQDSGCPIEYINKMYTHYKKCQIDPKSKKIVFSDSLDFDKAFKIADACDGIINCSFGIGTYLSNDFVDSKPLNIVIKPWAFNGIPVVKLGEGTGKVSGDPKAVEYTKWVFGKE